MTNFNQLLEKAISIIVEKKFASKYLLRKTFNINEDLANSIIQQLEIEGYISPSDGYSRRVVEQKAFDYIRRKSYYKQPNQSNDDYKENTNSSNIEKNSAYQILGLKIGASMDEIEKAYRAMAKMYHPDKVMGLAPEYMEIAERRMKEINIAYQQLKKRI